MKDRAHVPIRFKFMLTFLVLVTAVVAMITFSTANLFQEDKRAYVNDLTSMVALGAADEARTILGDNRERLSVYADLLTDSGLSRLEKTELLSRVFNRFSDLIAIRLEAEGEEPLAVYDMAVLNAVDVSREELLDLEGEHTPTSAGEGGTTVRVVNSTPSPELPCYTLSFGTFSSDGARETVVSAVIRNDRLVRRISRFSAYDVAITNSDGRVLVHTDPQRIVDRGTVALSVDRQELGSQYSAGLTVEFEEAGEAMIGGFAAVDFGDLIASAQIPRSAAHLSSRRLVTRLLYVAAVMLVLAVGLGFLWALRITRPVENLVKATRKVAKGDFEVEVESETRDEIGNLASSFTQMTSELRTREEALQEAQEQLVQSEKMAAFGQLGAGIAHEIKNPLAGILACAQISTREVEDGSQVKEDLQLIEKETKRCKTIIDNLLRFARQERSLKEPVAVNGVVEDAIAIVNHQLELNRVHVEKDLAADLPPVHANANQLQQVFMNLMINAQQAMEEKGGKIRVSSRVADNHEVVIEFRDDGPGIEPEIQGKLFEPFFTTKPSGKGTGLGLSVSYGVIEDHEGTIDVESAVGDGAAFIITLPEMTA